MTEVLKHIEVIANDFARRRFHSYAWPEDIEDATAVHAALVEAGFVVVPREPTEAMRFAGTEQFRPQAVQYSVSDGLRWQNCMNTAPIHIYRAMVEAAEK